MKGRPFFVRPFSPGQARRKRKPLFSAVLLLLIFSGCLFCPLFFTGDPAYMQLSSSHLPPGRDFFFGTDALGRDIFLMIWHGGRVSLLIGFLAAAIAAAAAILLGTLGGLAPAPLDAVLMRLNEILLSIPSLLLTVFLQAILGKATVASLSVVIGLSSFMGMARVVRTEVRQLKSSEYVIAARQMGAGFLRILCRHLLPGCMPSILFMTVMNIRGAIMAESTLSFMGMGLSLETVSWGSMLSLAERALSGGSWWVILIPGAFLLATLVSITELGNSLRDGLYQKQSNL
ncbi:MAG: ABC transporter permease [Provencibacterium sp.]|jgi:peptide/nickel transport system permease protein|nr:ABC transporter permease [Provencibacterium sp.]